MDLDFTAASQSWTLTWKETLLCLQMLEGDLVCTYFGPAQLAGGEDAVTFATTHATFHDDLWRTRLGSAVQFGSDHRQVRWELLDWQQLQPDHLMIRLQAQNTPLQAEHHWHVDEISGGMQRRTEQRHQLVLNFGREDVQDYILNLLDKLLSDYSIKFIKWDMNRPISEPGWPDAPAGHEREVWVRHTWGLYRILDDLRARHPNVLFESCSGGGGRVDLGILKRTDQVWTSDNTDPADYLLTAEGFSMAYISQTRMMWVTDSQSPNNRLPPLRYRFHAAMTGTLGVGSALTDWSAVEMEEARAQIALYKEIRTTVQQGHLYRLRSPRASELSAVQYIQRDGRHAVYIASCTVRTLGLCGLGCNCKDWKRWRNIGWKGCRSSIRRTPLRRQPLPLSW